MDFVFASCAFLHLLDDVIQLDHAEGVTGRVVILRSFVESSPHFEVSFSLLQPVDLHTAHCCIHSYSEFCFVACIPSRQTARGDRCFRERLLLPTVHPLQTVPYFRAGVSLANSEVSSYQARFLLSRMQSSSCFFARFSSSFFSSVMSSCHLREHSLYCVLLSAHSLFTAPRMMSSNFL